MRGMKAMDRSEGHELVQGTRQWRHRKGSCSPCNRCTCDTDTGESRQDGGVRSTRGAWARAGGGSLRTHTAGFHLTWGLLPTPAQSPLGWPGEGRDSTSPKGQPHSWSSPQHLAPGNYRTVASMLAVKVGCVCMGS